MGWLGWPYEVTMDTPMQAIETAYRGRVKMLQQIFGSEEKPQQTPEQIAKSFDKMISKSKPQKHRLSRKERKVKSG